MAAPPNHSINGPQAPPSPALKLEHSPAESFLSVSNSVEYSPLFTPESTPMETLSAPDPYQTAPETELIATLSMPLMEPPGPQPAPAEKKPTKKRKSWGQVLPEPKTNLPPRKRAKTEDEKEQRRVERVLRNRRAAQSSRERKRLEAEKLEMRNRELENTVACLQRSNLYLIDTLKKMKSGGPDSVDSPALQALLDNPTLGRSVFPPAGQQATDPLESMSMPDQGVVTVDPARISPDLAPIPEEHTVEPSPAAALEAARVADASLDLTQHPAAVLCDLQCQSIEAMRSPETPLADQELRKKALSWVLISIASTAMTLWATPLSYLVFSTKAGLPLHPSRPVLNLIIWLVTRPRTSWTNCHSSIARTAATRCSSRTTSSGSSLARPLAAPYSQNPSPSRTRSLRSKSLKKILTCSPGMARPLEDATLEVLRLVSQGHDDPASETAVDGISSGTECRHRRATLPVGWMPDAPLPSPEALLTLLWAIRVERRRFSKSGCRSPQAPPAVPGHIPINS